MRHEVSRAWWVGEAIRDHKSSVMAVTAGLGSGKTHGSCQWHHDRVRINKESRFSAFMEPTFQKVMDTAIPNYEKVLKSIGRVEGRHFRVIRSSFPRIVYLDQPHEVHFLSAVNPDSIAGVEYSHATEDEAGVNSKEARDNLRGRLYRDPQAKLSQYLIGGAPQGINAFADEFDSQTLPGWDVSKSGDHVLVREVENVLIQKRRFIVWSDDNPFVRPQYLAELQDTYGHNPNLIRSYRYGEFCPLTAGAAYSNYFPQKHQLDKDIEPDRYLDIALTWDFNANPLAWIAFQKFTFTEFGNRLQRYIGVHEANQGSANLDEAILEFAVKFPVELFADTLIELYGDSSGHAKSHKVAGSDYDNIRRILTRLGYKRVVIRAIHHNPLETETVEALNNAFLRNVLNLCPRLRLARKSLMSTTWKDNTRKLDKPSDDTWTHHSDAMKYFAYVALRNFTNSPRREIHGVN